jgi:colanic acid/amylovoran biosynthesis glycosyltransferase
VKILIYNHSFFPISETFVYNQILGLSENNEVVLLSEKYENENIIHLENKKLKYRPYYGIVDGILKRVLAFLYDNNNRLSPVAFFKLKKLLRTEGIDVIHAHFGPLAIRILPVAKALKIPLVVTFHGVDASPASMQKSGYQKNIIKLLKYVNDIIIVSKHMIGTLHLQENVKKAHWLPCGIDENTFIRKTPYPSENALVKFLHAGRLVSKKGVPDLIKAFIELAKKHHVHLDIIGDGPEKQQCEELINAAGLGDSIIMWGSKPHSFVKDMLDQTHVFVLNSRTGSNGDMEGVPNCLLEAMSMEIPTISTYHAGIPDVITSEYDGILVEERNNEQLLMQMERLVQNKNLCINLGKRARQTVVQSFSIKHTIEGLTKIMAKNVN